MNEPPRRKPMRLPSWDYASPGAYFFTAVVVDRLPLLGVVRGDLVHVNPGGAAVRGAWGCLPSLFPSLELDAFIVMPNHVHGVVWLTDTVPPTGRGAASSAPTLGAVLRGFKSIAARDANRALVRSGRLWQRGYYERVVRTERELRDIRAYVIDNPRRWALDHENPDRG